MLIDCFFFVKGIENYFVVKKKHKLINTSEFTMNEMKTSREFYVQLNLEVFLNFNITRNLPKALATLAKKC